MWAVCISVTVSFENLCVSLRYWRRYPRKVAQDGDIGRPWPHLLPGHMKSADICWDSSLWKRPDSLESNSFSWRKHERGHIWGRQERLKLSLAIPHNPGETHNWEGTQKPGALTSGVKGLYTASGTPTFKTCIWEISPQNIWLWKPMGLSMREDSKVKQAVLRESLKIASGGYWGS